MICLRNPNCTGRFDCDADMCFAPRSCYKIKSFPMKICKVCCRSLPNRDRFFPGGLTCRWCRRKKDREYRKLHPPLTSAQRKELKAKQKIEQQKENRRTQLERNKFESYLGYRFEMNALEEIKRVNKFQFDDSLTIIPLEVGFDVIMGEIPLLTFKKNIIYQSELKNIIASLRHGFKYGNVRRTKKDK